MSSTVGVSAGSSRLRAVRFRLGPRMFQSRRTPSGLSLESLGVFEQHRRRRLPLCQKVRDRAHFLIRVDRLAYPHELADLLDPGQPFA